MRRRIRGLDSQLNPPPSPGTIEKKLCKTKKNINEIFGINQLRSAKFRFC